MNRSVVYTSQARRDADAEWNFLEARSGVDLADRFFVTLDRTSKLLAESPSIGRPSSLETLPLASVRQMQLHSPFQHWLIFYLPSQTGIVVLRIIHGARDLPELFA